MSATNTIYTSPEGARLVEQRYREYLAQWPVPNEQLTVPTREGDTFVVACGPPEAPPLLLLHGSAANTAMWMGDVVAWSRHFRVYAVDVIGEPGLSAPSRPPLASEAYALWLDDVLRALAVERVSIVGVSLGGWLALDYATRRPGRVDRLALLCPAGIGRQRWGTLVAALLVMPFGRWGGRTAMRLALGVAPPMDEDAPPEARAFAEYVALINKYFRRRVTKLPTFDDATLRALDAPTLVIVGGWDGLLDSHDTRRRLERAAPQATVRLLPDAGHLLLEQTQPILEFLRS